MRLYHSPQSRTRLALLLSLLLMVSGCASPQATQALITVSLLADGQTNTLQLPAGSTVQQVLDASGLSLDALDRTEPPIYTVLGNGAEVRLVRVRESFEVEQEVIPFERQTLRNESLPQDQEILIQKGQNGLKEITYRRVYEDSVEVSSEPIPVQSVIVEAPVPEIRMIGIQAPLAPIAIPGRLLYLRDGNVWAIESSTGDRRALLTTGDLDGRIFSLSNDGAWLLFSRRSAQEGRINSLWVANLNAVPTSPGTTLGEADLLDLQVPNVIHFADWMYDSNVRVIFSTVEPRAAAPGWQANNDLTSINFSLTGWTTKWITLLEANAGGVYGWWGTSFTWEPDGARLAYARPDGIGLVDLQTGVMTPTLEIIPLLTRRDWAWVPGLSWGPDGQILYTVDHVAPPSSSAPEESQQFDLAAIPLAGGPLLHLVSQTGMFAYPLASPFQGDANYQVAFLQAIFPSQSETSRYRLAVMDRDGSNQRLLFPASEAAGLEPQRDWGAWSPAALPGSGGYALAVLYQGNLWVIDSTNGDAVQVTGDGLTTRVIWTSLPEITTEN
ncbi:MAG: G5 domain-containing protein [Chloroflexota bacterium]